jgi:hypothetical protein
MAHRLINFEKWKNLIDWKLLVLLLFFLNVKLAIKIPAIAFIYLMQPNVKFGFSIKNSRLPLFYLLILGIAFLGLLINGGYQNVNYLVVFLTGILFWLLCLLAIHQVKLSIDTHSATVIHRTIMLFFIINTAFSLANLGLIIWETGTINPYRYQGHYQKYFMGTGDYIKGVTFDTSTTNAVMNAIGVLYFLDKKNYILLLLCMAVMLLTGSNFLNIAILIILAILFIVKSTTNQKSIMVVCVLMMVVFMVKVSPQNNKYVSENIKHLLKKDTGKISQPQTPIIPIELQADSLLSFEERKEKIAILFLDSLNKSQQPKIIEKASKVIVKNDKGGIILPFDNIHSPTFQSIKVPLKAQEPMLVFAAKHRNSLPYSGQKGIVLDLPGKALGLFQTFIFFKRHPFKFIFGKGMGNFSSKLAYRATGLNIAGGFPKPYIYIDPDFLRNHLDLYLYFFSKQSGYHSLTNNPFSVYDQILAEYGLFGFVAFLIYYVGFFLKHYQKLTYGLPVLLLMGLVFFVDYWFEQLSIVIFFELMLLLNIKEWRATDE